MPLAGLLARIGPLALVALETTGPADSRSAEVLELAALLVDPVGSSPRTLRALFRPEDPLARGPSGSEGEWAGEIEEAPRRSDEIARIADALRGRTLIGWEVEEARRFLARDFASGFAKSPVLEIGDLLALTHPDAREGQGPAPFAGGSRRARDRTDDVLDILLATAVGAEALDSRSMNARSALESQLPDSPWLGLLGTTTGLGDEGVETRQFLLIGGSDEEPVLNDVEAIGRVLEDTERGGRHFPGYRVRKEQVELMRGFHQSLVHGGHLLIEGGTGVGKSLAYLAAAIPFAMDPARAGSREPLLISTRTKLLQDQLLEKDIAAAARMLGYPGLRALSIKGRANYVCERLLQDTLAAGSDAALLAEDRSAYAVLLACARTRPGGEVGSLPASMLRRYPLLVDLVHRSVARRAEQCSREECALRRSCPFGKRRSALARAHLVVANHDLLLRWPPDYPHFEHVIADEGHELAGVADEVYAQVVRPEEIRERIDEIFGEPEVSAASPGTGLLPRKQRQEAAREVAEARRSLALDFAGIGRSVSSRAGDYGEVQLPAEAARLFPDAARLAELAAGRLEAVARLAEELDGRAEWSFDETPASTSDGPTPVQRNAEALREAAIGLRRAFMGGGEDAVAAFDRLVVPYDRWVLAIRSISPAASFHEQFMEGLESFSAVSASLFVGGDAFASTGELELEERSTFGMDRLVAPSPFDYANNMRVAALRSGSGTEDPVSATAQVLGILARQLGGRTLGLFTSLRRMNEVAEILALDLAPEGIEVLAPRRAVDDPGSLVARFRDLPGGGVLLGSRTFWQGIDIPGEDLQAVVIEKLPFEVPTELRRRREARVAEFGQNAFQRYRLGKMLLNLKQMTGRLIRGETDRGIVVIVEARTDRSYFDQLEEAFPPGTPIRVVEPIELPGLLAELDLGGLDRP